MASYQATGKLHEIYEVRQITQTFQTREFVIETADGQYKEYIKFQSTQDRTNLIESFKVGDLITVSFDIRGRAYTNKQGDQAYMTNLNAWRIEHASTGGAQGSPQQGPYGNPVYTQQGGGQQGAQAQGQQQGGQAQGQQQGGYALPASGESTDDLPF